MGLNLNRLLYFLLGKILMYYFYFIKFQAQLSTMVSSLMVNQYLFK